MNEIEKYLNEKKLEYSVKKLLNVNIYTINDEKILVYIKNKKDNVFSITRDVFTLIDDELLPYIFFLSDNNNVLYYYQIKEPNNDLRYAFDNSSKDKIFFGKSILNHKVTYKELDDIIKKI